jgi:hypothetical protein
MAPRRFYERPAGARRVYRARVAAGGMCTSTKAVSARPGLARTSTTRAARRPACASLVRLRFAAAWPGGWAARPSTR